MLSPRDLEVRTMAMEEIPLDEMRRHRDEMHDAYRAQALGSFKQIKSWMRDSDEWSVVDYPADRTIQLWERTVDGGDNPIYMMKVKGFIHSAHTNPEMRRNDTIATKLSKMLCDYNTVTRLSWEEPDMVDIRLIDSIDPLNAETSLQRPHTAVIWSHIKIPSPIADRDFVNVQFAFCKPSRHHTEDREWWVIHRHTTHERYPPNENSGLVRGQQTTGTHLRPTKKGVQISIVTWVRPNGLIPAATVKLYKSRLGDRVRYYDDIIRNGKLGELYSQW